MAPTNKPELLLDYLDALVRADEGPAGFKGRVCVGVRHATGTSWWQGDFGARKQSHRIETLPADFDVAVGLDAATARWALGVEGNPGELHLLTGDAKLWSRFVNRYARHLTALGLRSRPGGSL